MYNPLSKEHHYDSPTSQHGERNDSQVHHPFLLDRPLIAEQRYSIWVPLHDPSNPVEKTLLNIVDLLSTQNSSPCFLPHITLLGGLVNVPLEQLHRSCSRVAANSSRFVAPVIDIAKGSTFYKNVYALFDSESTRILTNLHRELRYDIATEVQIPPEQVDPTPSNHYEPHLSLAYGLHQDATKDAAITTIKRQLHLDNNTATQQKMLRVQIDCIAVVEANLSLPINQWNVLQRYFLNSSSLSGA